MRTECISSLLPNFAWFSISNKDSQFVALFDSHISGNSSYHSVGCDQNLAASKARSQLQSNYPTVFSLHFTENCLNNSTRWWEAHSAQMQVKGKTSSGSYLRILIQADNSTVQHVLPHMLSLAANANRRFVPSRSLDTNAEPMMRNDWWPYSDLSNGQHKMRRGLWLELRWTSRQEEKKGQPPQGHVIGVPNPALFQSPSFCLHFHCIYVPHGTYTALYHHSTSTTC